MSLLTLSRCIVSGLLVAVSSISLSAQNLVKNPKFELGPLDWGIFIPNEEKSAVRFDVIEDEGINGSRAARLFSPEIARFAIASKTSVEVQPGMRFRIRAVYKAEPGFEVRRGSPGLVLRATFVLAPGMPGPVNHYFVGPQGDVSLGVSPKLAAAQLATTWTPIEAVIVVPDGVTRMALNFFVWNFRGAVLVDDFSIEPTQNEPSASLAPVPPQPIAAGWSNHEAGDGTIEVSKRDRTALPRS